MSRVSDGLTLCDGTIGVREVFECTARDSALDFGQRNLQKFGLYRAGLSNRVPFGM